MDQWWWLLSNQNPKVYVEMMFWKNVKECREIMDGYGSYHAASTKAKVMWTEEQEAELRALYEEHKDTEGSLPWFLITSRHSRNLGTGVHPLISAP